MGEREPMKQSFQAVLALLAILLLFGIPRAAAEAGSGLRTFLYDIEGAYGWKPVKGEITYDFFKDGRLSVQGNDGEATMWEGVWKLKGDQLTLKVPALKIDRTVTVAIEGGDLLLGADRYTRYRP
jgi:hypothetical protein